MEISTETLLQLRKYANDELSPEERVSVERMLEQNPALRAELELTRQLIQSTKKFEKQRLLARIRQLDTPAEHRSAWDAFKETMLNIWARINDLFTMPAQRPKLAWITALFLLVISAGIWWFSQSPDPLQIYQQSAYIAPAALESLQRGNGSTTLSQAFREFETGNYTQSLALLETISKRDSHFLLVRFLQAHNYYRLGEYDKVIQAIDQLDTRPDPAVPYVLPNPDNASWTRILALLGQYNSTKSENQKTELDRAIEQFLQTAENPSDVYYKKALELQGLLR